LAQLQTYQQGWLVRFCSPARDCKRVLKWQVKRLVKNLHRMADFKKLLILRFSDFVILFEEHADFEKVGLLI